MPDRQRMLPDGRGLVGCPGGVNAALLSPSGQTRLTWRTAFAAAIGGAIAWGACALSETIEPLSDHPERVLAATQGWGRLGWDTAAHADALAGEPLRLGEQTFAQGLGHHAPGRLEVLLDGEFTAFEAWVGLQPCAGGGSVIFRAWVDGEVRFESGVMRANDPPQRVRVAVAGAQVLSLEADDAGDGITCDMANWADARLIGSATPPLALAGLDMAPFGQVVTWDPDRREGTRATRLESFPEEDLFPETELHPDADGLYAAPRYAGGQACVGVQWLNRRAVQELRLSLEEPPRLPEAGTVRVEGWLGESAWQGAWRVLAGEMRREGRTLVFSAAGRSPAGGPLLTQKVRWVWPAGEGTDPVRVKRPEVRTRSRWATASFLVQFERPGRVPAGWDAVPDPAQAVRIEVFNGEWVEAPTIRWSATGVQRFTVRHSRSSPLRSDPTHLRLTFPWDGMTVAVEDVLAHEAVYLPDFGVFFCWADRPISLADYRRAIAGRRTLLEEVRGLPEQTLAQAMTRTHHAVQREGPVLLSLAADNTKYVVERDGTIRFRTTPDLTPQWSEGAGRVQLEFVDRPAEQVHRHLDGGWLPVPVINRSHDGVLLSQRVLVAPTDDPGGDPARLNREAVAVIEFAVSAAHATSPVTPLRLSFALGETGAPAPVLETVPFGFLVKQGDTPFAVVKRWGHSRLGPTLSGASLIFPRETFLAGGDRWVLYLLPPGFPPERLADLPGPERLRAAVEAYWQAVLAPAAQIETPEPFLNDLIRASQVRCWIAARNEADGTRIAPWIAAMSYGPLESEAHSVIRGMDFLGHHGFARRGLEYFLQRYGPEGFLTTGYTTFGTAWHLWTLGEHDELTRDADWRARVAPELKRVGRWIVAQTEKTRRAATAGSGGAAAAAAAEATGLNPRFLQAGFRPESGLMPPGVLADWNAFAYHFCLNAYYAAALRHLGEVLERSGDPEATDFLAAGDRLRQATREAYDWTRATAPAVPLRDGTWVGYYPSQVHSPGRVGEFFPGEDAGRSWCYDVELGAHQLVPTGVLDPFDPRVGPMLDHMEDVPFLADGWFDYPARENAADWFHRGGFSKVQPYYTRNGEIYARRHDPKPFLRSYFNALASLLNPEVLTFWEHFHHSGAWDKTHETGYFLHQTRLMLVAEHDAELWLAPLIPSAWLHPGRSVAVKGAPTRFGPVSYRLTSGLAQGRIEAEIAPPTERLPRRLALHLRVPDGQVLRQVRVNGAPHADFEAEPPLIRLPPNQGRLQVRAEFGPAEDYFSSRSSLGGKGGNFACGSVWYQNATEAMSSWSGR